MSPPPPLTPQASDLLKVLGHPVRLGIVELLAGGEMSVNVLGDRLGQTQPIISGQLRLLRYSGLVKCDRRGGKTYYSLADPGLKKLLACLRRYAEGR